MSADIRHGDLFNVLPTLAAESIHGCVTDPPYGIGFMGKKWDTFAPKEGQSRIVPNHAADSDNPNLKGRKRGPASSPSAVEYDRSTAGQREFQTWTEAWGREVFRVLKPGSYLLVCGAPRSFHRMACGLEDAGFEIRDCFSWLFGQGFPKSLNLKGEFDGWGTGLKPSWEPIVVARKPLAGKVLANMQAHGVGAINIDACRISTTDDLSGGATGKQSAIMPLGGANARPSHSRAGEASAPGPRGGDERGRWPANCLLDEIAAAALDEQAGELQSGAPVGVKAGGQGNAYGAYAGGIPVTGCGDSGGASRFFYVAKPSQAERNSGIHTSQNIHPTVKPVDLMRWLVRLVIPRGGMCLDPFNGSGTTGMACVHEGVDYIGIEREAEYVEIAMRRIGSVLPLL